MWKKLAIAFFYNTIKGMVKQVFGGIGVEVLATVPDDLLLAIIGYLVHTKTQYRDEGEALLISAVASLGSTTGLAIFGQLFGGGATAGGQAQTQTTTTMAYEVIR
jgi:membrane protein DedA with SNARE-associated domain